MASGSKFFDKDRDVIPRWRDFRVTAAIGELNSAEDVELQWETPEDDSLIPKLRAWQFHRSLPFAADLVTSAFVLGRFNEVTEAAQLILTKPDEVTDTLRSIAEQVLNPTTEEAHIVALQQPSILEPQDIRHSIQRLRIRIRNEPRNTMAYVDLARLYTLFDQPEPAKRAMRMALKLAPTNRFVLRSASRLFMHTGDYDEAHNILRNADSTKYDPWLLSAEIAVGSAVDRPIRFAGSGQRMLASFSDSPFEITELASALAMLEFRHGKSRDARKLFRKALIAPTENSVAQVEWASRRIAGLDDVEATRLEIPCNYEARAWEHYTNGNWTDAVKESWNWLNDEPFSPRAGHLGSYIASSMLEDYDESERIIKNSLTANPDDTLLLNNLAFTYASSGRVVEAEKIIDKIGYIESGSSNEIVVKATKGLIRYRSGRHSEGRALYREAFEMSSNFSLSFRAMAALLYAREEILAKAADAQKIKEMALGLIKNVEDKDVQIMAQKLIDLNPQETKIE